MNQEQHELLVQAHQQMLNLAQINEVQMKLSMSMREDLMAAQIALRAVCEVLSPEGKRLAAEHIREFGEEFRDRFAKDHPDRAIDGFSIAINAYIEGLGAAPIAEGVK
ncbi:hypothetical protein ACOTE8_29230 [Achromobacter xylosoxidans]|uniref:hypothetical protein n=1 Tax=Alcaligenes xylosoxydans xylosoxydans TaxID=85698 RepID=UPI0010619E0D|nr:hypothetical protein [Achromobacter xylosoxidans]